MSDQLDYHWIYISRVLFEINLDSYFANGLVLYQVAKDWVQSSVSLVRDNRTKTEFICPKWIDHPLNVS